MIIGVPKERKTLEKRIALTPDAAKNLTSAGHKVLIEKDAGLGSLLSNEDYISAGCTIVNTLAEVWQQSELLVKVKEPHEEEYQYFREDLILFDYLHLASMPDLTKILAESGMTSIAYELVRGKDGGLPLLDPMSEVAGKLSVINGATHLLAQHGGRGILLGGSVGTRRARVTIVGAGISGSAACEYAVGLGAQVKVFDICMHALEKNSRSFR